MKRLRALIALLKAYRDLFKTNLRFVATRRAQGVSFNDIKDEGKQLSKPTRS